MLTHPLFEKLSRLRLNGMLSALKEQMDMTDIDRLDFEQRLDLLVDREVCDRENRQLKSRLTKAKLRLSACVEDIDFRQRRGLDKALFLQLAQCRWIKEHHNLIITGPTGVGKTYLACALAHNACRQGYTALYRRLPKLMQDLFINQHLLDSRNARQLNDRRFARVKQAAQQRIRRLFQIGDLEPSGGLRLEKCRSDRLPC